MHVQYANKSVYINSICIFDAGRAVWLFCCYCCFTIFLTLTFTLFFTLFNSSTFRTKSLFEFASDESMITGIQN